MKETRSLWSYTAMFLIAVSLVVVIFLSGTGLGYYVGRDTGIVAGLSQGYIDGVVDGLTEGREKGVLDSLALSTKICEKRLPFKLTQNPQDKQYYCISASEVSSNYRELKVDTYPP